MQDAGVEALSANRAAMISSLLLNPRSRFNSQLVTALGCSTSGSYHWLDWGTFLDVPMANVNGVARVAGAPFAAARLSFPSQLAS